LPDIHNIKIFAALLLALTTASMICFASNLTLIIYVSLFVTFFLIAFFVQNISRNSILLLIFLYPLLPFHVGIDLGGAMPVLKSQRIVMILVIIFWLTDRFIINNRKDGLLLNFPFIKWIGVVVFCCIVCVVGSGGNPVAIKYIFGLFFESYLLMIIVWDIFQTEKDQKILLLAICFSGVVLFLVGLLEYISGENYYAKFGIFREEMTFAIEQYIRFGLNRVRGAFPHAISYGAASVIIGALVFVLPSFIKTKPINKLVPYFYGISLIMCYFSYSRGPIVMWTVPLLFFLLKERIKLLISCLLLVFIAATVGLNEEFFLVKLFNESLNLKSNIGTSSYARIELIKQAFPFIMQKPITGWGFYPTNSYLDITIDNYYIKLLLNFGFLGLIAITSMYIVISMSAFWIFRNNFNKFQNDFSYFFVSVSLSIFILFLVVGIEHYMY
jgi:hypothetical protein